MDKENLEKLKKDLKSQVTGDMIVSRYAPQEKLSEVYRDGNYIIRCFLPGHKDDSPSLSISRDKFVYHCFGQCPEDVNKGDFIKLVQVMENCPFMDALKILCHIGGIVFEAYNNKAIKNSEPEQPKAEILLLPQEQPTPEIPLSVIDKFHNNLLDNKEWFDKFNKKRGIPLEIIKKFKLGADDHGNYTIPIMENGKYVSIKYRRSDDETKKAKYWSHKSIGPDGEVIKYGKARLFRSDEAKSAPAGTICIICAGEFDAIRLSEFSDRGIISVSGTSGEGDWNDEWNAALSHLKCIVCYDNDKAGVSGSNLVTKSLKNSQAMFLAPVSELKEDKLDITEYFLRGGTIDGFIAKVKEKIEVPNPQDRKEASQPANENQTDLLESLSDNDIKAMNPAFYINDDGVVYITAMFERKKVFEESRGAGKNKTVEQIEYISNEPIIISSRKELFEIPRVDRKIKMEDPYAVAKFGEYTLKNEPFNAQNRWCGKNVMSWLKGERELYTDTKQSFLDIYNTIKEYAKLSRKTYRGLVALYVMGSYFYEGFPSFPYLHLHGEKGSGKTTLAKVIAALSFNGDFQVNPTLASLARGTEELKGLVVIDEAEKQSQREQGRSDLGQILNAGYQRGAKRKVCDMDNGNKIVAFDLYCPKVICNIFGLNDTTKNRCITVKMQKIEKANLNKQDPEKSESIREISRRMYDILMSKSKDLLACFDEVNKMDKFSYLETNIDHPALRVFGRERELYLPLISIARLIYKDSGYAAPWDNLLNELNQISEEKLDDEDETPESVLRDYVIKTLDDKKVNEYDFTIYDLINGYQERHVEPVHNIEKWISGVIKKCDWCLDYDRRKRVRIEIPAKDANGIVSLKPKQLRVYTISREKMKLPVIERLKEIPF